MDLGALISTFGLMLVAELGDKTQLAVLSQTCKFRRPGPVFAGASLALTGVTALGVAVGQVIGEWITPGTVQVAAAVGFLAIGLLLVLDNVRTGGVCQGRGPACELREELDSSSAGVGREVNRPTDVAVFASTFGLLFLAELGDKTMLTILGLASKHRAPWAVFLGGALALTVVTGIGVIGGQGLSRVLPKRLLRWLSAVAFLVIGILTATGVF